MKREISIEGVIGVDENMQFDEKKLYSDDDAFIVSSLRTLIDCTKDLTNADRLVVNIRSTGGNHFEALDMYAHLKSLPCHVDTYGFGYIASAAVTILQSGRSRHISSNALLLVHNCKCEYSGTAAELTEMASIMCRHDGIIASILADRSKVACQVFFDLMSENNGNGRWLSAEEVLNLGIADEIITPQN